MSQKRAMTNFLHKMSLKEIEDMKAMIGDDCPSYSIDWTAKFILGKSSTENGSWSGHPEDATSETEVEVDHRHMNSRKVTFWFSSINFV